MALCLPLLASAQGARLDPADPQAAAPALRYRSAFADYKAWQDPRPGDWRTVNDTVRDAAADGGAHAGHATPAAAPAAAAAPAPKASAPMPPAHGGHHHRHGGKR